MTNRRRMGWWRSWLDSLDTGGGHIFILMILIAWGSRMYMIDATAGGQIITLAFGALLALTKSVKSNKEQLDDDGDETPTSQVVVPLIPSPTKVDTTVVQQPPAPKQDAIVFPSEEQKQPENKEGQ